MTESMGVGSWFQQGPGNGASQAGQVSDRALTYSVSQATAAVASSVALAADATSVTRKVLLFIPSTADTGVYIDFGAVASSADFFIPAGASLEISTLQEIRCIRAGAADVTIYILSGVAT